MESMRDIRTRMVSVQKTMKITNAMYLMASSKLRRARERLANTEPYFQKLQMTITDILAHTDMSAERYFATDREIPPEEVKNSYLLVTSDKGLAGSYNHNVIRLAAEKMSQTQHNKVCCVGYSGRNYMVKHPELGTLEEEVCISAVNPTVWQARRMAEHMIADFLEGRVDAVYVVYTRMKNALVCEAECLQLLPLTLNMFPYQPSADDWNYVTEYSPSPRAVLNQIVPNYLKGIVFGCMTEAFAAEQNARMMAMDNATKNAGEIVRELSLQYNRVRQAAITTEITEVVSGANAQQQ